MGLFRHENHLAILFAVITGCYMKSVESFVSNKFIIMFLKVWSKIPILCTPISLFIDLWSLFHKERTILERIGMLRKCIAFSGFFLKNVMYHFMYKKIDNLIDLWDNSFQDDFYKGERKSICSLVMVGYLKLVNQPCNLIRAKNFSWLIPPVPGIEEIREAICKKRNNKLLYYSISLALTAALAYALPSYFSKEKKVNYPTGIEYKHKSPDHELIVTFMLIVALSAISSASFDCILFVLLTGVISKLTFLKATLADIINEIVIDNQGRLMLRKREQRLLEGPQSSDSVETEPDEEKIVDYFDEDIPVDDSAEWKNYEEVDSNSEKLKTQLKEIDIKMRIWIRQHQKTIKFFDELKKTYSAASSVELIYIVSYTGLTALHVVHVRLSLVAVGIALVASSNMLSLFLWCTLGSELEDTHVSGDAFGRTWYLLPKKVKTAFSFIIMQSKKPLALKGCALYSMTLATFFEILKLTYQFFAFMSQAI